MKAVIQDQYEKNRQVLHEIVPLDMPFSLSIEPTTFCNLKCNYCSIGVGKQQRKLSHMSDDTFLSIVDNLKRFPHPLKTITFVGLGEPMTNKRLPFMVETLKNNQLAEKIYVITNGVLINSQWTNDFVNAGLDVLKISVNGLSADDYKTICGAEIDFNKFLSNLSYLYSNKKNMTIFAKILNTVLGERNEQEFFDMFGDYCDVISIENTVRSFNDVDYSTIIKTPKLSKFSSITKPVRICSAPFFRMFVGVNGEVNMCGGPGKPLSDLQSIKTLRLVDAWNGTLHKQLLKNVLTEKYEGITEKCNTCSGRNCMAFENDSLDDHALEIYQRIDNIS
jgi:MoaA/NifB/PqqE/SkfB family radical SAM enzyme